MPSNRDGGLTFGVLLLAVLLLVVSPPAVIVNAQQPPPIVTVLIVVIVVTLGGRVYRLVVCGLDLSDPDFEEFSWYRVERVVEFGWHRIFERVVEFIWY
jgi:hypothetical protein